MNTPQNYNNYLYVQTLKKKEKKKFIISTWESNKMLVILCV